ncbi:MAG: FlgD immunoglobulin-like domain containing protein [Gemmatimonadota bacterium]
MRTRGTLVLTGGEYAIGSLQIDLGATVIVRAPTTLLIADQLGLGHWAYFGPEEGGINAADIRVYVAGRSGHDDRGTTTGMGVYSSFSGNLYAPNGTVRLNQQAKLIGSAIARDVVVGVGADVYLANGWRTPGVVCQTQPLPTARPSVGSPAAGPASVQLLENYPNPFNGSTTIRYELPAAGTVRLAIYNALGQQVRVLVDGPQPEGVHRVEWNGRDAGGFPVSSGAYFSRLESGEGAQVRRMVLVQ